MKQKRLNTVIIMRNSLHKFLKIKKAFPQSRVKTKTLACSAKISHLAMLFTFALRSTQPDNIAIPFKKCQKTNNPVRSVKIKITKKPSIVDRNHPSAHDISE